MIMLFAACVCVRIYDRILLPLASRIRGKPVRMNAKKRMGIGLFFYFLQLIVAATVETIRRRKVIEEGHIDDVHAVLDMSVVWLLPELCVSGIAEAFNDFNRRERELGFR